MAVSAPIRGVILTANESKKKISQGRDAIKSVGQVILKRTKVKREAFAQTNIFRKRREENEKRQTLEDELEAPRVVIKPTGPQQLIQATGAGGFFKRILGFIGYLAAGWIMNNLPTWIAMGKEFVARLQRAGEIVSGFFNNTIKLFANVSNILGALGQNLMQFDFFDTSNRVKNAMGELNTTMGNLTGQIEEAFELLTTPLTEGKYSGEEIPKTGTQQTDPGAYVEPPPYSGSGGGTASGTDKLILDLIASVEAGRENYDSVNGGSRTGKSPTQSTIGEIARSRQGATGRYQHMPAFILGRAKSAGFNEKTLFTPAVQDKITLKFLEDSHSYSAWKSGKITDRQFAQKLAVTWRGLPYDERNLTYQDQYARYNKAHTTFANVLSKLNTAKKSPRQISVRQAPNQASLPALPPTDTLGGGVQRYGASRDKGARKHAGTDFDIRGNEKFYSRIGGVVTKVEYQRGGYGHYIDIYNAQLGVYERIAEGARVLVKKGQAIQPGQPVVQGESSTGVIHYEIRKNAGYGFAGTLDPVAFLKNTPTQTQIASSPAQISAPPQQTNMVPFSLTPERRGQDVMVIMPQQQQNIITPASGNGDMGPSAISDFELLNNFIKNKLLLDLAYL